MAMNRTPKIPCSLVHKGKQQSNDLDIAKIRCQSECQMAALALGEGRPEAFWSTKTQRRYKSTARVAVRVVPLPAAEIVADVEIRTIDVRTVKDALLAPAGTITLEGTLAGLLLLESIIVIPPAGAGPVRVTVPVEDCRPPMTLDGFSLSDETVAGGGTGATVSEAELVAPR
jgi:hypothetical protein